MDIPAYLDRIDYRGPLNRDAETLRQLHLAHLLRVPFENLSIHAQEAIVLDDAALYGKIVHRRRGGFCYELNGLFAALLRELGFDVTMLSAQVHTDEGRYTPEFAHMTLMVTINHKRWLADVGFGDSFIEPLPLDPEAETRQRESKYRIVVDSEACLVLERSQDQGEWEPQYRFRVKQYQYPDYAEMCRYQETSPESHFTQKRICSRLTSLGRISLSDMRFIETEHGQRKERELTNDEEYRIILRDQFGIVM